MKPTSKLAPAVLLGLALCVAAMAGSHSDSVSSYSYYYSGWGSQQGGNHYSSNSFSAPEGAELNWGAEAYSSGSGYAYASVNIYGGGLNESCSASGYGSDGGYWFTPSGGATYNYNIQADTYHNYWEGSASAYAYIVAGW